MDNSSNKNEISRGQAILDLSIEDLDSGDEALGQREVPEDILNGYRELETMLEHVTQIRSDIDDLLKECKPKKKAKAKKAE